VRRWKPISRWQLQPDIYESFALRWTLLPLFALLCLHIITIVCLYLASKSAVVTMLYYLPSFIQACCLFWPSGENLEDYTLIWQMLKRMAKEDVISNATEGAISTV